MPFDVPDVTVDKRKFYIILLPSHKANIRLPVCLHKCSGREVKSMKDRYCISSR